MIKNALIYCGAEAYDNDFISLLNAKKVLPPLEYIPLQFVVVVNGILIVSRTRTSGV